MVPFGVLPICCGPVWCAHCCCILFYCCVCNVNCYRTPPRFIVAFCCVVFVVGTFSLLLHFVLLLCLQRQLLHLVVSATSIVIAHPQGLLLHFVALCLLLLHFVYCCKILLHCVICCFCIVLLCYLLFLHCVIFFYCCVCCRCVFFYYYCLYCCCILFYCLQRQLLSHTPKVTCWYYLVVFVVVTLCLLLLYFVLLSTTSIVIAHRFIFIMFNGILKK